MMSTPIKIAILEKELQTELDNILHFWMNNMLDFIHGGFIGQIDAETHKNRDAVKGAVMHARVLWTFSAAFHDDPNPALLTVAERAFNYIQDNFYDPENGGIFWSLNPDGSPKETKNQIYAIAFVIYGMSEYYGISKNNEALDRAKSLYLQIEKHSYDPIHKGYLEAFTRDWQPIEDLRLSDKDVNEKKTMNTHLHIVEAYANLYKYWKDETLRLQVVDLLETIGSYFIDTRTGHLKLFFNENWIENPDVISYGHDIEAAWLLLQCAEITEDADLIKRFQNYAILLTDATKEGIDTDGGLWYEWNPEKKEMIAEKHWWAQAELLIGFFNAWELTGNDAYLDIVLKNWEFIKEHMVDKEYGEWFWGINADYSKMEKDKAGFWKCPYHNGRACMELIHRIKKYKNEKMLS